MKETKTLEFKQKITDTFLKTVSAYANYGDGKILFGVDDNGNAVGINNPKGKCLVIENKINDNIKPKPDFSFDIDDETQVITLTVYEGGYKPYYYDSKAYKRNDTSTVEMDRLELSRLILEGDNLSYEELKAKRQDLTFSVLEKLLKEKLGIQELTKDILTTLELFSKDSGYNKAAELLADDNDFSGVDSVRFGDSISVIMDRENYEHQSILSQYFNAIEMFKKYYQYEEITGSIREIKELIPEAAFREAIANALAHRTWDINSNITVFMFEDKIEITSPGGLPKGITLEEYLNGGISIPRNRIICNVFLRLKMIERFGTGIRRISEAYNDYIVKPQYIVSDNIIKVILPVLTKSEEGLGETERLILKILKENHGKRLSSSEISKATNLGKTRIVEILNQMSKAGYIAKSGVGRGTGYRVI